MLAVVRALAHAADRGGDEDREAALQRARDAFRLLDTRERALVTPLAQAVAGADADPHRFDWAAPLGALLTDAPLESLRALDGRLTTRQAQTCEPVAAALAARADPRRQQPDAGRAAAALRPERVQAGAA